MKKTHKTIFIVFSIFIVFFLLFNSCKKEHNPYSDVNYNDTAVNNIPIDSLTITYIHNKVLSTRCALPGCHVGNFEPDYRTPQSSYSTLVYAAVKKNNADSSYKYRVVPYDTAMSVLYARITNCCFVNANDRMPQDNIAVPLPDSSIHLIARWIMTGARDMFGHVATLPNTEPLITFDGGISMDLLTAFSNNRLSAVPYNPFIVPDTVSSFYVAALVTDDSTPTNAMLYNQLKISIHADDFSSAWSFPATCFPSGNSYVWVMTVNTASLPQNDTLYMRYFVNDGSHVNITEFPRNDQPYYYKTYWSFIRQ